MKNYDEVIKIFAEMAKIWEILGQEYKVYAYLRAINLLKLGLNTGPGIGKKLAVKIEEIIKTGTLQEYEELKSLPEIKSIEILHRIKGFGPEFIKKNKLVSISDIIKRVKSGKLKLNQMQQIGLKYYKDLIQPIPRDEIAKTFKAIKAKKLTNGKLYLVGSYRRGKKSSKDIDILLVRKKINNHNNDNILSKFIDKLKQMNIILDYFINGQTRFSGILQIPGINKIPRQIDILLVPEEDLWPAMLHSTGSNNFNRRIRLIAKMKGMKLSEKGLFKGKRKMNISSEKEIFDILDIPYLEPKDRIV